MKNIQTNERHISMFKIEKLKIFNRSNKLSQLLDKNIFKLQTDKHYGYLNETELQRLEIYNKCRAELEKLWRFETGLKKKANNI